MLRLWQPLMDNDVPSPMSYLVHLGNPEPQLQDLTNSTINTGVSSGQTASVRSISQYRAQDDAKQSLEKAGFRVLFEYVKQGALFLYSHADDANDVEPTLSITISQIKLPSATKDGKVQKMDGWLVEVHSRTLNEASEVPNMTRHLYQFAQYVSEY